VINEIDWSAELGEQTDKAYDYIRGLLQLNPDGTTSIEFKETITLQPSFEPAEPVDGGFELELKNAEGISVKKQKFKPLKLKADAGAETSDAEVLSFVVPVEEAPDYSTIVVSQGEEELGSITASPNAPEVSIVSPGFGTVVGAEDLVVEWAASDADGDALNAVVQYSVDGGDTRCSGVVGDDSPCSACRFTSGSCACDRQRRHAVRDRRVRPLQRGQLGPRGGRDLAGDELRVRRCAVGLPQCRGE